jgi:hypothetical protein
MTHSRVFSAWDIQALGLAEFVALGDARAAHLSREQARYLLGFSLLAPTSHNSVPQAYTLDLERDEIGVFLRRQHIPEASDPTGREALVSIGCAVENLATAAAQYGICCSWQAEPNLAWGAARPCEAPATERIGRLRLQQGNDVPVQTTRALTLGTLVERRVLRGEFDKGVALPSPLGLSLQASAADSQRVTLRLFTADQDKFAWGKLDELAMKYKLEERAFQRELGEWLLPNEDQHSWRGMRGREFGLDDDVTRELGAQLRGEAPMAVDQLAFMARAGRVGLASASAVCVVACKDDSPEAALQAGRLYQRCALMAWAHGMANAVHTSVCKVPHTRAMSQATLLQGQAPSVIFRLGRPLRSADWSRQHSSRPCLDDLLLNADAPPAQPLTRQASSSPPLHA